VVSKVLENPFETFGFDAQTETYGDLVEAGIVDPAKVVRTALQDAASVASLLVTTEALVADRPQEKAPPALLGGPDFEPRARRTADPSPGKLGGIVVARSTPCHASNSDRNSGSAAGRRFGPCRRVQAGASAARGGAGRSAPIGG
jgi:hypothetical protein